MLQAILFDFDGLLVDTESSAYDSWQEIYAEYGCTLPLQEWKHILGSAGTAFDPCAHLEGLTGQTLDHAALRARRLERKSVMVANEPLLPGIYQAIGYAKEQQIKIGVASSSRREWVQGHLDRLGVTALFDTIVCREDVMRTKPAPDVYQTAITRLGVAPDTAVAIEDSLNGLQAAKAAGLWCIVVPNKFLYDSDFSQADIRLDSLADQPCAELFGQITAMIDNL